MAIFFQRDWEATCSIPAGEDGNFDLIWDYTVGPMFSWRLSVGASWKISKAGVVLLTGLAVREEWARIMRELLPPNGFLIA